MLRNSFSYISRARWLTVIAAAIIGLGVGIAAILFRFLIQEVTWIFSGGVTNNPSGFHALSWWWILLMPAVGGLIVGIMVRTLAPEVKGTGVPEVMEAVALHGGHIRKRVGLIKAMVVAICLGSGGSAGREGPIVHIGASVGSLIGRLFKVPSDQVRTFVGCGAAAGIAATFNAPISGAMFAGEVILGQFGVVRFSAIVISSVVATVLSRYFIGDFPAFVVPAFRMYHTYELLFYAVLGLLAALVGCLFILVFDRTRDFFERLTIPQILKPSIGGLLVGAIGIGFPQVMGVGYGSINEVMHSALPWMFMLAILIGKLLATSLTLGSGGSGGIFAPSLFLGATLGGLVGVGLQEILPSHVGSVGSYALVAMGAMVAATTRAPISAILIVFEMTNNYTIILPLMIACILATLVAGLIVKPSIYHTKLLRRGVDLEEYQTINVLRNKKIEEVHLGQSFLIRENASLQDILEMAANHGATHYVVVDKQGNYIGFIPFSELRHIFFNEDILGDLILAADLVQGNVPTLLSTDSLDLALKLMHETSSDTLPVLKSADQTQVLGVITRDAVLDAYNRELFNRDMAGEVAGLVVAAERARTVDLGDEILLKELEVPLRFVGKQLKSLDLRRQFGIQIVLVRRRVIKGGKVNIKREIPGPDFVLEKGDMILILGTPDSPEIS
jgi:CIC family chloride channel protein